MGDNKQIKDGLGNLFTLRMRDVSPGTDGTLQQNEMFATLVPREYQTGGMYQHCAKSNAVLLPALATTTATGTGTASATNLTVSAVTGTIIVGATVTGTGIPAGTTIVNQQSGTTGGAGVYTTSASTTASAAALTFTYTAPSTPNVPIYSFQYPGTLSAPFLMASVRRVRLSAWSIDAFSAGWITFDIYAARNFTAQDTGGLIATFGADDNQMRTSMAAALANITWCNTALLTPGTRTLDAAPLDSQTVVAPTTANTPFTQQRITLFERLQGEHSLLLAANEGFVVRGTFPGGNHWQFAVTTEWDELAIY